MPDLTPSSRVLRTPRLRLCLSPPPSPPPPVVSIAGRRPSCSGRSLSQRSVVGLFFSLLSPQPFLGTWLDITAFQLPSSRLQPLRLPHSPEGWIFYYDSNVFLPSFLDTFLSPYFHLHLHLALLKSHEAFSSTNARVFPLVNNLNPCNFAGKSNTNSMYWELGMGDMLS